MEYKLRAKIEQNEEEIKTWGDFEPIAAGWMFPTLKAKRYEPSVQPITRITNQLNDLNRVIWKELWLGIRTPEGVGSNCAWRNKTIPVTFARRVVDLPMGYSTSTH